jgi:hypothetical protein
VRGISHVDRNRTCEESMKHLLGYVIGACRVFGSGKNKC